MKTSYDCIPCFIRQTLEAVRFASSDQNVHELVLRKVLKAVSSMDLKKSPPVMGQYIHRIIRKYAGSSDPYQKVKKKFNSYALELYPVLKGIVETSANRFETAVRLAIAGNIIDFGVNAEVNQEVISKNIDLSLSEQLFGDLESFHDAVNSAGKILYLGDNTGEIVFDRLLIEQLPKENVIFAVRGAPVINDATMADAVDTKMNDFVTVIDNGSDAPGIVLEECSEPFKQFFHRADLIIAKGQGNFETLSDTDKTIFFLLKAKCAVVARHIGCHVGESVISRINHEKPE
ncbi:MAG: ARMT1-like domain-containing protein [Desulfobacterales bacterium]